MQCKFSPVRSMGDNDFVRDISSGVLSPLIVVSSLSIVLCCYIFVNVFCFFTLSPVRCTRQTNFLCFSFCLFVIVSFCFNAGNMVIWPPVVLVILANARSD